MGNHHVNDTDQTTREAVLGADGPTILLGRIADRLDAQRIELYEFRNDHAVLTGRWTAFEMPIDASEPERLPLDWFPWSLGSVRPSEYLFVRNAGPLPVTVCRGLCITDLAVGSALMVPLIERARTIGALCVYWRDERQSWPSSERGPVLEWALDALSRR